MSRAPSTPPPSQQPPALGNPPRQVPMLVYLANLVGGFYNQLGWFWVGFTLIFFWAIMPLSDMQGPWDFSGELASATAEVTRSKRTSSSEESDGDRAPSFMITYRFTASDDREYEGVAFVTGESLREGRMVQVEYRPDNPTISRLRGQEHDTFLDEGWVLCIMPAFLLVFLSVGVVFMGVGIRQGLRANHLLAKGRLALGKLKSKEPTNVRINGKTVYEFTFEFVGEDGRKHEMTARTHKTEELSDPDGEYLLYDPARPAVAVMLDGLPGGVGVDEAGHLTPADPVRAMCWLIGPGIVTAVHGTVAYFVWFY